LFWAILLLKTTKKAENIKNNLSETVKNCRAKIRVVGKPEDIGLTYGSSLILKTTAYFKSRDKMAEMICKAFGRLRVLRENWSSGPRTCSRLPVGTLKGYTLE